MTGIFEKTVILWQNLLKKPRTGETLSEADAELNGNSSGYDETREFPQIRIKVYF